MSQDVYQEPGIIKKVRFAQDDKEGIMDIYVSTESLRVYDNPWVENMSSHLPGPAEAQHQTCMYIIVFNLKNNNNKLEY